MDNKDKNMNNDMSVDLEARLQDRYTPPVPDMMVSAILAAAREMPQDQRLVDIVQAQIRRWVSGFMDGVLLPRPALAFCVVLLIGLGIGIFADTDMSVSTVFSDATSDELSFAFASDDIFYSGDYL